MPRLSAVTVKNAKPGRHADGDGLYLLVKHTGSRSWMLRVQVDKRRRDFGLGSVSLEPIKADIPIERRKMLTLAEAREKARIYRALAKDKVDLLHHRRQLSRAPEAAHTFRSVAEARHKSLKSGWKNGKHRDEWLGSLERYAFKLIGDTPIELVDTSAIEKVLMPIWLAKPETARRVKQRIGIVLDYAHGQGWRSAEAPIRAVSAAMGAIKQPKRGHFAAMPYKDLPAFLAKLRDEETSVGRLALQFLILNVSRSGEVRFATWQEIDFEAAEWRIPAERMKAGEPHVVPLGSASIAILERLKETSAATPDDLVFPGLKGVMSDATMAKVLRKADAGGYTVHGFRSTFRDWAADTGFADAWAEAALAHSVAGQAGSTVAAYKRTTYFEHRREKLMPAWASFALGDTSNIVELATARAKGGQ
jgi:integrase